LRGDEQRQAGFIVMTSLEDVAPDDHPLRVIRAAVLQEDRATARETAAGLVLQAFFVAVTGGAEGDESLRDVRSDQARSILNEMRRLKPEDTPQRDDPWAGLYWEKPASSYLWQGTEGGRPRRKWQAALEQAKKEYRHAIEPTGATKGERSRSAPAWRWPAICGAPCRTRRRRRSPPDRRNVRVMPSTAR